MVLTERNAETLLHIGLLSRRCLGLSMRSREDTKLQKKKFYIEESRRHEGKQALSRCEVGAIRGSVSCEGT